MYLSLIINVLYHNVIIIHDIVFKYLLNNNNNMHIKYDYNMIIIWLSKKSILIESNFLI